MGWVPHIGQEGIDGRFGDGLHGLVKSPCQVEQVTQRQAGVEQDGTGSSGFDIRAAVSLGPRRQNPFAGKGLQHGLRHTGRVRGIRQVEAGTRRECGQQRLIGGLETTVVGHTWSFGVGRSRPDGLCSLPSFVGSVRTCVHSGQEPRISSSVAPLPSAGQDGKDAQLVQAMFDRVAPRYDLANAVLSLGQDAHWRRATALGAQASGAVCLDVASGPGNVAQALLAAGADRVVAVDLSLGMLQVGTGRGLPDIDWVQGTATQLPIADESVDAVTICFGLRNVPDAAAAIGEFARVLRPGGRLVIAEFAAPTWAPFRIAYHEYLLRLLPKVAELVSSDGRSYRYLAESILAWPDRRTLARWLTEQGFDDVRVKNLSGGIVALHRGVKAP